MNGRMYDPVLARFLSPDKLLQNPSNTQNYNGYSYVLNNPLKYTDPSGWAYGGYRFLSYSNTSFNGWTTQDGFDDVGFNYNAHTGHAIDGIPCSNLEFAAAVRAGGTVHIPGIESFIVVTQADGTVSKFEDTGEAIDFYNEISSDFKLSVDFDGGLRLDNIKEKPISIPAIAATSLESLSAGGDGAPGGKPNTDPQDGNKNIRKTNEKIVDTYIENRNLYGPPPMGKKSEILQFYKYLDKLEKSPFHYEHIKEGPWKLELQPIDSIPLNLIPRIII